MHALLRLTRCLRAACAALLLPCLAVASASARDPNPAKYPLRVHVLAADETHKSLRMTPAESLVCDSVEGIIDTGGSGIGSPLTLSGISADPCLLHPEILSGRMLALGDDAPLYSGSGRGDLVSPPYTTQGISFQYDDCVRMRVRPGFTSLPARWKKPGRRLEVLVPSDGIPVHGRPLPPQRCSLSVTLHDFVFLLLRNGSIVEVSQDLYRARPAMRVLLSGRTETVQHRLEQYTVPAHPPG